MKGGEFERRVQRRARRKKVAFLFGDDFATLKDRKKEIGRRLLAKMCRDLNIDPHEL